MVDPRLRLTKERHMTANVALRNRLAKLQAALSAGLVERGVAVRLALLAGVAGEHLLLVGPPGTAKSLVARRLHLAFDGTYFERLLTRFSVPEELFGPLSIKGLESDRYERLTAGYLPCASVAFLDEIFKANSAILNSLLTLLNERLFDNGAHRVPAPLVSAIGASNELPDGEELDALFDRFLLRLEVCGVSESGFRALVEPGSIAEPQIDAELRLAESDLRELRDAATQVTLPDGILEILQELRSWCLAEKIAVSDRRWRKVVQLLRVSAWTNGRAEVSIWDLWLLQHCVWQKPDDRRKLFDWYAARVGADQMVGVGSLVDFVVGLEGVLDQALDERHAVDASGRALYRKQNGTQTTDVYTSRQQMRDGSGLYTPPNGWGCHYGDENRARENGLTRHELDRGYVKEKGRNISFDNWEGREAFLADIKNQFPPPESNAPMMAIPLKPAAYVRRQRADAQRTKEDLLAHRNGLERRIHSLESEIDSHLWIDDGFASVARSSLDRAVDEVSELLERVEKIQANLQLIPTEG